MINEKYDRSALQFFTVVENNISRIANGFIEEYHVRLEHSRIEKIFGLSF